MNTPASSPRTARLIWRLLAWIGIGSLLLPLAAYGLLRLLVAPLPGEWTTELQVGPAQLRAGVPSLIRLATSAWLAPQLDGHRWTTSAGTLRFHWLAESRALQIDCAPCTLRLRGLGEEPVVVPALEFTVQRDFSDLQGLVTAQDGAGRSVRGSWQAHLDTARVRMALDIPPTPMADGFALFADRIPELGRAKITGQFALKARLDLPNGELELTPRIEGFTVTGLGTEALADAQSACAPPAAATARRGKRTVPELPLDGWLARAVIAAEDQRFWQHGGIDVAELQAALRVRQDSAGPVRGASTLSQQLAKLLVTGPEKSASRKLRELLYAADMEQTLGKSRILRLYLENAPWGSGVCGAQAAAHAYFDTRVRDLTPAQAVWLAAMLHNPGLEYTRWAERGRIDLARASWVAQGVRGIDRRQRAELAADVRLAAAWPAPPPR